MGGKPAPPVQNVWMRAAAPIGDDPVFNQAVLAYASDMSFLSTSMRPHGLNWQRAGLQTASLDHASGSTGPATSTTGTCSPSAAPLPPARAGMNLGAIYSHDGRLVASAAQEGLMRYHPPTEG